jgi:UDP-N-acetylglucosamine transferase subunit ALG13
VIFVTTGTQLAFPRLVSAMDRLAPELGERVVAQIGPDPRRYCALEVATHLSPERFETLVSEARVIVAHAGIGTILTARRHGKPLILMARRYELGEHRNDHQAATLAAIAGRPGLYIAADAADLKELLSNTDLRPAEDAPGDDLPRLTSFVQAWISGDD